ncbi:DHHC zinc finger domain containing protein [Trichomonas vaginalis G3]|uniref:Palmitoyltransferase n=1 Tax=Trichomonas vaginalis (strain ATCC PRA-98 / G3) TaxID=412133 RepID=A2FE68_TRIV3|nr:cysteine S-palmitoyltransferase protein [Trichomonas vaginalis G3]EAX96797.1 DHHC zinc finger domain containing protein [Trichomonas vaginalis G3]KAI5509590.1 cysteine S-palmitoyltransferase protein [Trichomonas vaginalis G3]|eukprot:XP_001309727.1 DHHC zinc finger domain containing protein [Trichomonas vaginalis G3]
MLISNICFLLSYFATIFEGPGFLPFYYPLQITKRDDGVPDYLSGVVSNEQQENYVRSKPKMSRVGFFKTVQRYVLRPDHFCGWTGQFIGKKNYKLFVLFNIWGAIYTSQFLGYCVFALVSNLSLPQPFIPSLLFTLIYMLQCILFCMMTCNFGCVGIYNIHTNSTQLEQMQDNKNSYAKPNCIDNWEEVCGPRAKWYFWIFPVPAFHDKSSEYLLTHTV